MAETSRSSLKKGVKRESTSIESSQFNKIQHVNLTTLIRDSVLSEKTEEEIERLIGLVADVDDYDEKEIDCTPLRYAVEQRFLVWTKLLLKNGADPELASVELKNKKVQTVTDLAWSNRDYDIVVELLRADAPFPKIDAKKLNQLSQEPGVESVISQVAALHENIAKNLIEGVRDFTENNPKTKHAYGRNNKSAITVALESKNFKIYVFLRSKGFSSGIDGSHEVLRRGLTNEDKTLLDVEVEKNLLGADFHILDLLSKSRLGMNNDGKLFGNLKEYFEKLDKFNEIQQILKLIATDKTLTMIFDFNREDIGNMDPARYASNNKYKVRGRTYEKTKKILIAAKKRSDPELLGTLAQELAHFAMLRIYDNKFLPYQSGDFNNEGKFEDIMDACETNRLKEKIIDDAFNYDDTNKIAAELIARIPQLIVQNQPEKLTENQKDFKDLFKYFYEKVFEDIKLEVLRVESRKMVQDLNKTFGLLHRLKTTTLRCERFASHSNSEVIELLEKPGNIFIGSKLPELVLVNIIESFKLSDSENVFVELEQLTIKSNLDSIVHNFHKKFRPTTFVLDSDNVERDRVDSVLEVLRDFKIVFLSSKTLDSSQPFTRNPKIQLTFDDLTSESKQELLNSKLIFQGLKVELKELFGDKLEVIKSWPLEDVLSAFKKEFSNFEMFFPKVSDVFVSRSFQVSETGEVLTAEEVVAKLGQKKTMILADVAGMGKTTSAVHFARTIKTPQLSLIVFFDLKQHIKVFEGHKDNREVDFYSVLEKMINFKNKFEQKCFKHFFENSETIFVIDGFDEISPIYKRFVLNLIRHVKECKNRLMVTTRTYLEEDLKKELESESMPITTLNIMPLSVANQIEFLTRFWAQKTENAADKDLAIKARLLIEKFETSLSQKQIFLEIPLQLFMLADLTSENPGSFIGDLKLFSLYNRFVRKKLLIYNNRGELTSSDNVNITMEDFSVLLFHQKIAIEATHGKIVVDSLKFPEIPQSLNKEVICRIGFLQIGLNGEYQFTHQTFGDFFIALALIKSVTTEAFVDKFNVLHDLFAKVLVGDTHYDENIRNFINGKLESNESIFCKAEMSQKLEQNLNDTSRYGFLIRLVEKKQFHLINFVLKTLKLKKEIKMKILEYKNVLNSNALHVATAGVDSWKVLWNCIEGFAEEGERKQLLTTRGGVHNETIWLMSQTSGLEQMDVLHEIHKKLFNDDFTFINSLLLSSAETSAQKQGGSALQLLWNAIEENLEADQQKKLLFEKPHCGLFHDLIMTRVGAQIALRIVKKLFNKDELNSLALKAEWFRKDGDRYTLSSKHLRVALILHQEILNADNEKNSFEDLINQMEMQDEGEHSTELSTIGKTFDALNIFVKQSTSTEKSLNSLSKCIGSTLVQMSASHSSDFVSSVWKFVVTNFDENEQRKLLMFKFKSMNILMVVMLNENKSTLKFIFERFNELFTRLAFKQELNAEWVMDTLCKYAASADVEAFELLRSFFKANLDDDYHKLVLVQKKENGYSPFMYSAQNKNVSTVQLVISTVESLLAPEDYTSALQILGDQNWIADTLCHYVYFAEIDALAVFWSFLKRHLNRDALKLVLLKKKANEYNTLMYSVLSKNKSTIEFVINTVRDLLDCRDFEEAMTSAEHQNWLVYTLAYYAGNAECDVFKQIWSILQENLTKNQQKLVFMERDKHKDNLLMCSAGNIDTKTIQLVIATLRNFLEPDEIAIAWNSYKDQNWVIDTLCKFARFAKRDAFELFWSFLQENLGEVNRKLIFLLEDMNELNVLMCCAENDDKSTIEFIIKEAGCRFVRNDFENAPNSTFDQNWFIETLCRFARFAKADVFELFWSFLQKKLDNDGLKLAFLTKNPRGSNALMSSVHNENRSTIEFVITAVRQLLVSEDSATEPQSLLDQHWLVDTLCHFALFADAEVFRMFWSFLNLKKDYEQKLVLLQEDQNQRCALLCFAFNKDKSTLKFILKLFKELLNDSNVRDSAFFLFWFNHHTEDFDRYGIHFEPYEFSSYLKKTFFNRSLLSFLAHAVDPEVSSILWNKTTQYLDPTEIEKQLLAKDKDGDNCLSNAAFNTRGLLLEFLEWFKGSKLNKGELKKVFVEKNNSSNTIMHMVALHGDKSLRGRVLDFVSLSFEKTEIQEILKKPNGKGETPQEIFERREKS